MEQLLKSLIALYHYYQTLHWQCKGPAFYSDHLLAEKLYSSASDGVDSVGERCVALKGRESVSLPALLPEIHSMLDSLPYATAENGDMFKAALELEGKLIDLLIALEKVQGLGTKDLLAGLANDSESRRYLLKQRTSAASAVKPTQLP